MNSTTKIRYSRILQRVYNHLKKQNKQSKDKENCKYRLEIDGEILKCAIGCLIPNKKYRKELEGLPVQSIRELSRNFDDIKFYNYKETKNVKLLRNILKKSCGYLKFPNSLLNFLQDLQDIHDEYKPEYWQDKFAQYAQANGLILKV